MKSKTKTEFDTLFMKDIETALCIAFERNGALTVYPKGKSMLPSLKEGKSSVELSRVSSVSVGEIYLYKRPNGEYVLHRLLKIKNGEYIFGGDNQLVFEKVKKEQLLAQVTRIYKNEKRYDRKLSYKVFLSLNSVFCFRWVMIKARAFKKRLWVNKDEKQ